MKKNIFTLFLILISAAVQAQEANSINKRLAGLGQDSIDVLGCYSLYEEAYEKGRKAFFEDKDTLNAQNFFLEAIEPWEFVFHKAPCFTRRIYSNGETMLSTLMILEKDSTKKNEYFGRLMNVFDQKINNIETLNSLGGKPLKKGEIISTKGYYHYYYNLAKDKDYNTIYEMFTGIDEINEETPTHVLSAFIACSYDRYMSNKENNDVRQEFIEDYIHTNEICDIFLEEAKKYPVDTIPADTASDDPLKQVDHIELTDSAKIIINKYQPVLNNANYYFQNSGAANPKDLERIYAPKIEANKTNLQYLNTVLTIFREAKCDTSKLYYIASDYAYQINKTPKAAIGKATRLLRENDITEAIKYFDEAIELEPDNAQKAKYAYIVAQLLYSQRKYSQSRQYCRKTLQFNPSYGKAYLVQARCIIRLASGDNLQKSYYYCLATDYCYQAKAADPSTQAEADKEIATYAAYYYPKTEAFFAGIKAGQKVNVAGETTTLRLR